MGCRYQTFMGFAWIALNVTAMTEARADADACARVASAVLDDVTIEAATLQPAGEAVEGAFPLDPNGATSTTPVSGLPGFCRILGSAQPEAASNIRFEVWLPSEGWSGRFMGGNNGGFAGYISYGDLAAAVATGHASASTDTGHVGSTQADSTWAKGHPERVRDYGFRAIHVTTVAAKRLIASYYGRGPDYSYFMGCSNGGRQGLMEAARFPEDYDGIIAGAPAANFTALAAAFASTVQAQMEPGAVLGADQMSALQAEVLKQCDGLDGQVDGLVAAPMACRLDTTHLSCSTELTSECFTPAQLEALTRILEGRRDGFRRTSAAGFPSSGAEAGPLGWGGWLAADRQDPTPHAVFAYGLLQNLMQQPTATPETFDFAQDQQALDAALGRDLNVEPRLRPFFARGGKLIMWQGWADAAVPARLTLAFYGQVWRDAGWAALDALRLFVYLGC